VPDRFEIRFTVEADRARRRRSLPFVPQALLVVVGTLAIGWIMVSAMTLAMKVGVSGILLDSVLFVPLVLAAIGVAAFRRTLRSTFLTVGADGVQVQRFRGKRFVPYSRIRGITREGRHLVLDERGRPPLRLLIEHDRRPRRDSPLTQAEVRRRVDEVIGRIEDARAGYGKSSALAPLEALVGGAQCTPTWLAQVRGATRREDYRENPISIENLWPIVEDAATPARERLTAAIALRPNLDAAGQSRLRVAAEATLAPRVRVALEAALEDDDEALAKSFAALEAEKA
jgi:hypothetical protein